MSVATTRASVNHGISMGALLAELKKRGLTSVTVANWNRYVGTQRKGGFMTPSLYRTLVGLARGTKWGVTEVGVFQDRSAKGTTIAPPWEDPPGPKNEVV